MAREQRRSHPLLELSDEDLEFVLRLVLASGSLKELARFYGVSYPTIRARLDRLIERLRALLSGRRTEPMFELLASLLEGGEVSLLAARRIRDLYRKERA